MLIRLLPFAFVLLWSTGFIGAKYGLPYVEPYTFLAIRFVITLVFLGLIVLFVKPKFPPKGPIYLHLAFVGILIQVVYLGGVFSAIKLGLPAGIAAVIVGVQPILTVLVIHRLQSKFIFLAAILGFIGLLLVIFGGKGTQLDTAISLKNCIPSFLALLGITFGTLYQKKYCSSVPVIVNAFVQFVPTCVFFILLALVFETGQGQTIIWHPELIMALLWLVIVLSIGAILLMNLMYQQNSASSAASYFYLTPPVTLVLSYFLFDETITMINVVGISLVVLSVYLTNKIK
jgi:drug/metabolite transporter (DMT)-like permease